MRKLTQEEVISKFIKTHGNRYDYTQTNYVNMRTKVNITCRTHGDFTQLPYDHIKGSGCPHCHPLTVPLTTESFRDKAAKKHNKRYDYSKSEFSGSYEKVCIICPIHGEFWLTPNNHLNGLGCPICNQSKGELLIMKILDELNIQYIRLFKILVPELIRKTQEAFIDFYLPEYNTFIEYNGKQHYVPVKHFGGEVKFNELLNRDNYVKDYCIQNNISFLEIKFSESEDDIKSIILNFVKNL